MRNKGLTASSFLAHMRRSERPTAADARFLRNDRRAFRQSAGPIIILGATFARNRPVPLPRSATGALSAESWRPFNC